MNVLIKSWNSDSISLQHNTIELELMARNHKVIIDKQSNFPANQYGSIRLSNSEKATLRLSGEDICKSDGDSFDAVIFFAEKTFLLPRKISEKDKIFIETESKDFLNGSNDFLGEDVFWVNPPKSFARSVLKPVQLQIASRVGLTIPNTLISNTPDDIAHFVDDVGGQCIVKPFNNMTWTENDKAQSYLPTTLITKKHVEKHLESLSYCPMIFQERIKQKHEIRVTVFGHTVLAVKMMKKQVVDNTVDWRLDIGGENMIVEAFELPDDLKEKCIEINNQLELVYSTFDIAVDEQDNYIFYEVNNAGRFLWKETLAGLPMTNVFCDFIESRDPCFKLQSEIRF